jgi:hypothetical protein
MLDGSGATVWAYDIRKRKLGENKQIYLDDAHARVQTFSTSWTSAALIEFGTGLPMSEG